MFRETKENDSDNAINFCKEPKNNKERTPEVSSFTNERVRQNDPRGNHRIELHIVAGSHEFNSSNQKYCCNCSLAQRQLLNGIKQEKRICHNPQYYTG